MQAVTSLRSNRPDYNNRGNLAQRVEALQARIELFACLDIPEGAAFTIEVATLWWVIYS